MTFIVYAAFILIALFIASELNAEPVPAVQVKPAMAKGTATPPRLVIRVDRPVITSEPIDWTLWGVRDRRWVACRLGIKGSARLNNARAMELITAVIG